MSTAVAALSPKLGLAKPDKMSQPDSKPKQSKPAYATITLTLKEPSPDSQSIEKSLEIKGNIELLN